MKLVRPDREVDTATVEADSAPAARTSAATQQAIETDIVSRIAAEPDRAATAPAVNANQARDAEISLAVALNRLLFGARDLQMFLKVIPKVAPSQFDDMKGKYLSGMAEVKRAKQACEAVEAQWPQGIREQWSALRQVIDRIDQRFAAMLETHAAAIHDKNTVPADVKQTMTDAEADLVSLEKDMRTLHDALIAAGRG